MRVNKTLYVLCALFLGGVGIHKFYADKVGQGVLHFFFWTLIPTIVSIIHGIIIIFTTKAIIMDIFYTQIKQAKVLNFLL